LLPIYRYSFALLPLWFAYLVSPYGLLYLDGVTVVALPKKAADFSLAGTRERRHRNDRRGGFGKNCQASELLPKAYRLGMRFIRRARSASRLEFNYLLEAWIVFAIRESRI
jgi:hypothetical protein